MTGLDASGTRFGKYTIVGRIGAGGMAEVFKCRLSGIGGFDKTVVVKRILAEHLSNPEFVKMFLDEARLAANLTHNNIVQIYEIGEVQGLPYIAMEYVRGPTFASMVREQNHLRQPFPPGIAAKIVSGICEALQHVHHAKDEVGIPLGIIHRDVSLSNIIVSSEGVPKLVDFGVAKARANSAVTTAGAVKGKLNYMAPEQFRGKGFDQRIDIFAAGVCLYRAITGRSPFVGDTELELIQSGARGEFLAPKALVPSCPAELERIILWSMESNPDARCPDAGALHEALEAFVAGGPYATTRKTVRDCVARLFPTLDRDSMVGMSAYGGPPSNPSLSAQGFRTEVTNQIADPPEPHFEVTVSEEGRLKKWMVLGGLAVLGVITVLALLPHRRPPAPAADPETQPLATAVGLSERRRLESSAYLETADRLVSEGRIEAGRQALEKASTIAGDDAVLAVRLKEVEERLGIANLLAGARAALHAGDAKLALEKSAAVLAREADHPEAIQLAAQANEVLAKLASENDRAAALPASKAAVPSMRAKGPAPKGLEAPPVAAPSQDEPRPPAPPPAVEPRAAEVAAAAKVPERAVPKAVLLEPAIRAPGFACPEGAALTGDAPPAGSSRWCQLPDGTKHGHEVRWYPNGVKASEGDYRSGRKHGKWVEFYESGAERERTEWRNGIKSW